MAAGNILCRWAEENGQLVAGKPEMVGAVKYNHLIAGSGSDFFIMDGYDG